MTQHTIVKLSAGLLVLCASLGAQELPVTRGGDEQKFSANFDVRNRWVRDVGGSHDVYRTLVNLGEGPRLFDGNLRYRDPAGKFADEFDLTGHSWGGDPYNTLLLRARKSGVYSLRLDYRNVAYFNALPSFANPLLGEGILLSQRTFDITRRNFDSELEIRPNARISPFVSFSSASGFGRGVTTFIDSANEFAVGTDLDDRTNTFRGGVRMRTSRFNLTLEQGRTSFEDDQRIFNAEADNPGNRRSRFLGREILLDELSQRYRVRGDGLFNRAVIEGRPWSRLSFTGQFLYSQPETEVEFDSEALGDFFSVAGFSPFTAQSEQGSGLASRPRTSGSWNTEVRPLRRVRIVQSWFIDRFHVSAGSLVTQSLNTARERNSELRAFDLLVVNYNQHQVDVIVDVGSRVTLRGGHRYVWGDAESRDPTLLLRRDSPGPDGGSPGRLRRHVGLAGGSVRLHSKFSISADFEASPGDQTLFRTGLMDYQRAKVRARYRVRPSLTLNGSFSVLSNENPASDIQLDFLSRRSSLSLFWAPNNGRRFQVLADYTRATVRSDISVVELPFLGTRLADYRDDSHQAGAFAEIRLVRDIRLSVGGSVSVINGSRPTRYYQPRLLLRAPWSKTFAWTTEWRWYGFSETPYAQESFHTHMVSTGLAISF